MFKGIGKIVRRILSLVSMKNYRIKNRLGIGFTILVIMCLIVGYGGWTGLGNMRTAMSEYDLWARIADESTRISPRTS
jgi:hypothetical protein